MGDKNSDSPNRNSMAMLALVILTAAFAVVHILIRGVYQPGHPIRLVVTSLLVVAFALFLFFYVRTLSSLDEYQRQIQLFALAIGFPLSLALAWGIGYFRAEGFLQGRDPRDLPLVLLVPYGVGYLFAWLKYR